MADDDHPGQRLLGLHHLSLTVSDLETSVAWYRDVLGLEVLGENEHDGGRTVVMTQLATGIVILLQQHKAHEGTAFSEFRPGLDHISLRAGSPDELQRWATHLDTLDVAYRDILQEDWGAVLVFRDPDRIQIEVFSDPL